MFGFSRSGLQRSLLLIMFFFQKSLTNSKTATFQAIFPIFQHRFRASFASKCLEVKHWPVKLSWLVAVARRAGKCYRFSFSEKMKGLCFFAS